MCSHTILFKTLFFKHTILNTAPTCGKEEPLVGGVNRVPYAHFTAPTIHIRQGLIAHQL